jgi:SAM-dependent methyltransferase
MLRRLRERARSSSSSETPAEDAGGPWRCHVDEPGPGVVVDRPRFVLSGWVTSSIGPISGLHVEHSDGSKTALAVEERPDVREAHPGEHVAGFRGPVEVGPTPATVPTSVRWRSDGVEGSHPLAVAVDHGAVAAFSEAKARKLARIRDDLRCPRCGSPLAGTAELTCSDAGCGRGFPASGLAYDFLDGDNVAHGGVTPTTNVSAHPYTPETQEVVDGHRDGLVLDAGAGLRTEYLDHVVNLDVVGYATTDVLAIGERLPFRDGTFDAVVSIAVLEHVRHPFECARELVRVLRPGGTLLVMVPFLQPYHGYPDHYYNMTMNGVRNLFGDELRDVRQYVPESGLPIWTLTWFLDEWVRGLPEESAAQLRNMTVGELLGEAPQYLGEAFVVDLPPERRATIASTTCLIAQKATPSD